MRYYDFLFYLIVRAARRRWPGIPADRLAEGSFWTFNFGCLFYVLFALEPLLELRLPRNATVGIWLGWVGINYFVFLRGDRWQQFTQAFDEMPAPRRRTTTWVVAGAVFVSAALLAGHFVRVVAAKTNW